MAEDFLFKPGVDLSGYFASLTELEAKTQASADKVEAANKKLQDSFNTSTKAIAQSNTAVAKGADNIQASVNKASAGAEKLQKGLANVPNVTNRASNSLLNLDRVVQDLPFGFTAISNNIAPLQESFQRLVTDTGSVKGAFQALGSSLTGAAGIGFALSVVTSLIVTFGSQISDFFDKLDIGSGDVDKALKKQTEYTNALKEANTVLVELAKSYSNLYAVRSDQAVAALSLAQAQGKNESEIFDLKQKATEAQRLQNISILANLGLTEADVKYNETLLQYKQEQLAATLAQIGPEGKLSETDQNRANLLKAQIDSVKGITETGRKAVDSIRDANTQLANDAASNNKRIYDESLKSDTALAQARVLLAKKNTEEELQARIAAIRTQQRQEMAAVNLTSGEREKIIVEANKSVDKLNRDFATLQLQNQISLQKAIESTSLQGSEQYYAAKRNEIQLAAQIELNTEGQTAEKIKEIRAKLSRDLLTIDREQIIKAAQQRIGSNINNLNAQIATAGTQTGNSNRGEDIVKLQQQIVTEQAELEKVSIRNSELSAIEKNSKINLIDAQAFAQRKKLFDDFTKTSIKADEDYYNSRIELENAALNKIINSDKTGNRERFLANQKLLDNDILILQGQLDDKKELYDKDVDDFREYQTDINNIQSKIDDLTQKKSDNAKKNNRDLFSFLGLNQEQVEGYAAAASEVGKTTSDLFGAIADSYQQQVDARQAVVDADSKAIDDLQSNVDKQKQLYDDGVANNYDALKKQLEDKKAQREEDQKNLEDLQKRQAKARKAQLIADTVAQASNLVSAAAGIFAATSFIPPPFGQILAGATIAAMFAAFAAAKVTALKAASQIPDQTFGGGGVVDGPAHTQGGKKYRATDGSGDVVELEGGEHVTRKDSTRKALPLLESINDGSVWHMGEDALRDLLHGTGIHLSEAPKQTVKIIRERDSYRQAEMSKGSQPSEDLKGIRDDVKYMADKKRSEWEYGEDAHGAYKKKGGVTFYLPKKR